MLRPSLQLLVPDRVASDSPRICVSKRGLSEEGADIAELGDLFFASQSVA